MAPKTFTKDEVATHKDPNGSGLWIIVDNEVYDLTKFADEHPGGKKILLRNAGTDASKPFWKYHNQAILNKYKAKLHIGSVGGGASSATPNTIVQSKTGTSTGGANPAPGKAASSKDSAEVAKIAKVPGAAQSVTSKTSSAKAPASGKGTLSGSGEVGVTPAKSYAAPMPSGSKSTPVQDDEAEIQYFGDMNPYADPSWYQGWHSPYYKPHHHALRAEIREFVETEIEPFVHEWDEAKGMPNTIYEKMGQRGWLAGCLGVKYPTKYTDVRCKSVPPEKWDHFCELVITDELSRCGSGGVVWNLLGGYGIGCPPFLKFGNEEVKKRVLPDVLSGKKRFCLCITEPDAGSDVANLVTSAKKTADGKHFIVNGEKKWITNGLLSDYFTVAVRTGGPGMNGISLLLIEKSMPGVTTRQMKCQGVWASGTTYVEFDDVKVPVENLIGKENKGFKVIMTNFNHERIGIIIQANRFARVCYEEAFKYAQKRKTFGKKLIEHPVIRDKFANMARQIEATHANLELVIYQMEKMGDVEAMLRLGGAVAGLKAQSTKVFELCAREASQVFGGLSYSRGGQGDKVERLYRDVRAYAIPGGSEEIMQDLMMRQGMKVAQALGAKF